MTKVNLAAAITEEMLNTYFVPALIKVITPTIVGVIIATVLLILTRRVKNKKLAMLFEMLIKIGAVVVIGFGMIQAIESIRMGL